MKRLVPGVLIAGLALLSAACGESPAAPAGVGGAAASSAASANYTCVGCGKTEAVAASAPAPSC